MAKISEDHFYKQFDRYAEGQPRFEAAARHAAALLQNLEDRSAREVETLTRIRNMLAQDESPALIALMIQERLQSEFDTWADMPQLGKVNAND